jgi:hypothetical protein
LERFVMKINHVFLGRFARNGATWRTKAAPALFALLVSAGQAWAQVGGGTGDAEDVNERVLGVMTAFQLIMFSIGGVVLAAAFGYVGYGMAYQEKKWSDVKNVAAGAMVAGMCSMMVGWLFS